MRFAAYPHTKANVSPSERLFATFYPIVRTERPVDESGSLPVSAFCLSAVPVPVFMSVCHCVFAFVCSFPIYLALSAAGAFDAPADDEDDQMSPFNRRVVSAVRVYRQHSGRHTIKCED
jgi:hypothetical protein